MAPLPHNSTGIYYTDYSFQGHAHTMECRFKSTTAPLDARDSVSEFLNALATLLDNTWTITGARVQLAGSHISTPAAPPELTAAPSGGAVAPVNYPKFHSYVGRGTVTGRRARIFIYGLNLNLDDDYRIQGPGLTPLSNALAILQAGEPGGIWVSIGNDAVTWNEYVNQGLNSYWQRQARRGV